MKSFIQILLILLFFCQAGMAQLKIGGEIRTRAELRDGFKEPLADILNAALVENLRTRIYLYYQKENIRAKIIVQDTRTYGETSPNKTGNRTGVYEAWGEYAFNDAFSFRLGRQTLEYDDKRLFSVSNWSNTGNSHDALLLDYHTDDFTVNLVGAWNNGEDVFYESPYDHAYKSLVIFWMKKQFGFLQLSPIWINEGFQSGREPEEIKHRHFRNTLGGNVLLGDKKLPYSIRFTAYHQFGHDKAGNQLKADLVAIKATYAFDLFSFEAGGEYHSGSSHNLDEGKSHTFNKLYGSNHNFNGSMEYWTTTPQQGLWDIYGGVTAYPVNKFSVNVTWHNFSTVQKVANTGKKALGSELDITLDYLLHEQVKVQGGWSAYFTNSTLDAVKNKTTSTRFAHWAYLMIGFTF